MCMFVKKRDKLKRHQIIKANFQYINVGLIARCEMLLGQKGNRVIQQTYKY